MPKQIGHSSCIYLMHTQQGSQLIIEGNQVTDKLLEGYILHLSQEGLNKIQVIKISNSPITDVGIKDLLLDPQVFKTFLFHAA